VRLHVLTAVSRPENLPRVAESLSAAAMNVPDVKVCWHWRFDLERKHVGGQALKNEMLDEIEEGWVWVLDDDTEAHPDVLGAKDFEAYDAVVFSQVRSDGRVLLAAPENVVPGSIDINQAFLRRDLIGDLRIPIHYDGDGMFLNAVLKQGNVLYHPAALSLHNSISGVNVSV
jgi:hypothetical protein